MTELVLTDNTPPWFNKALRQNMVDVSQTLLPDSAFFMYDLDSLSAHLRQLQQQDVIKLWYAVKANPLSRVIQTLDKSGFNFDVASRGELQQVLAQGVSPNRILNTGPAKSKSQMLEFLTLGVGIFVVESINQLTWLNETAIELGKSPTVLLRVQLQWPDGERNPLGGNSLTPFGLSTNDWQNISLSDYPALDFAGLHIFQWGNLLSNERMFSLWSQMVPPLTELANKLGIELRILDLGGGLGVDYLQAGQQLSWRQIIDDLATIKQQAGVSEIWLELGRFAVAHTGYYVVPIVDRKTNNGEQQLVLAAGINHILRPAITDQPFPVTTLKSSNSEPAKFHIHGPLCTSMDKLGFLALPNDVAVNDYLVFGFCGAYGFTESMPFFLCHPVAAEYVVQGNDVSLVRQEQSAQWYLS